MNVKESTTRNHGAFADTDESLNDLKANSTVLTASDNNTEIIKASEIFHLEADDPRRGGKINNDTRKKWDTSSQSEGGNNLDSKEEIDWDTSEAVTSN